MEILLLPHCDYNVPLDLFYSNPLNPLGEVDLIKLLSLGKCKIENDGNKIYFSCESEELFGELVAAYNKNLENK